jgi:hypothetical protein
MLVFSTQLCELLRLQPYLCFNSPPFFVSKYSIYSVWLKGGGGSFETIILQEYTMYLTRFRTYKIARPPQTKT